MTIRKAKMSDLASIRHMYWDMVEEMKRCRMQIWDDVYPCEYLEKDIADGCFYIIEENGKIQGGFALCDSASGEDKEKLTVPELLEMFSKASGDEFSDDRAILS